jgi:toxin YoeB
MNICFQGNGWEHYLYWQTQDKKTLHKVNKLLQDIMRNGNSGTGKPELLTGNWSGWWSRRIDEKNRMIYRLVDGTIEIAQCREHYEDKERISGLTI